MSVTGSPDAAFLSSSMAVPPPPMQPTTQPLFSAPPATVAAPEDPLALQWSDIVAAAPDKADDSLRRRLGAPLLVLAALQPPFVMSNGASADGSKKVVAPKVCLLKLVAWLDTPAHRGHTDTYCAHHTVHNLLWRRSNNV